MSIRSPQEENGPDGYPLDNEAFEASARRVVNAGKADAEQAKRFLKQLRSRNVSKSVS